MNWLSELAVGDLVYMVPGDRRFHKPHHAQVTKKARKFVYFRRYEPADGSLSGYDVKADMTDSDHAVTFVNVGTGSDIYRNIQAYTEFLSVSKMRGRIEDAFRYGPKPTDEQVKQISAILNIDGEDDVRN